MQMFLLHKNQKKCARMLCDKHIVKIPTEIAQMISTVYHLQNKNVPSFLYKPTHINHPCSIWIRENLNNFLYALRLGKELYNEYQYRYNKPYKHQRNKKIFDYATKNLPDLNFEILTPFVLAMPEQYKRKDAIKSYREYYKGEKLHFAKWTKRPVPRFLKEKVK